MFDYKNVRVLYCPILVGTRCKLRDSCMNAIKRSAYPYQLKYPILDVDLPSRHVSIANILYDAYERKTNENNEDE